MTIYLSAILATHIWVNNQNIFVKVCEYRPKKEISNWYNHYPPRRYVAWESDCPYYITVSKK